jgi:4'-phosphopantetheinyl transferase
LKPGRIEIWFFNLEKLSTGLRGFHSELSPDEIARAARFRFSRDRDHYIKNRGILRELIGVYTNCNPSGVEIGYTSNGKPFLKNLRYNLQFSLSHSGGLAIYAFTLGGSVGVDIESISEISDLLKIVKNHFTPTELDSILSCPQDQRLELFYKFWTRKEAVLKAQGEGILKGLDIVDVTDKEVQGPWVVQVHGEEGIREYFLRDLEAPPHFAAAVASTDGPLDINIRKKFKIKSNRIRNL